MKKILLFLLFLNVFVISNAQVVDLGSAQKELARRGLSEDDFRTKMLERGIDVDQIKPEDLPSIESTIEEVVAELELEKQNRAQLADVDTSTVEILRDSLETLSEIDTAKNDTLVVIDETVKKPTENRTVNIYGQHLFVNNMVTPLNVFESGHPSESYVLGVGDKLTILIWGASQENATFEINSQGFIQPTKMPKINLGGLTFAAAKQLLRKRYGQYYKFRNEEFDVVLQSSRNITVNIIGEVENAGSFQLPAVNTAINALSLAGGMLPLGGVRTIKLIHSDGSTKMIDLYEYLLNPAKAYDFFLQDNDYIFVPVAATVVQINGLVNRPFKYEMKSGEGLKDLLKFAGGFGPNAYKKTIQVKRYSDDEEVIIDVDYTALVKSGKHFDLLNGDVVTVKSIPSEFKNYVSIDGAVELSGQYQFHENMTILDLVKKAKLKDDARLDNVFLMRENADKTRKYIKINLGAILKKKSENIVLQSKDQLIVYSLANYKDNEVFVVEGAVRNPGEHPFDNSGKLRVSDVISMSGGLLPIAADFAYIYRNDPDNHRIRQYLRVNISEILANPESANNFTIRPFDKIIIYDYASFMDETYIQVDGSVRKPGQFLYDKTLTLRDVLTFAGGLKMEADKSRVELSRVVIGKNNQTRTIVSILEVDDDYKINGEEFPLEPFDRIYIRSAPEFELQQTILVKGEVAFPGKYDLVNDNERVFNVIKRAGGITKEGFAAGATLYRLYESVGYIVMDLSEVMRNPKSKFNFILRDGDIIEIPKQKDVVTIMGETKAREIYPDKILRAGKFNVPYEGRKSARWYVDNYAAGIGKEGRARLITVEQPNGQIERTKNYIFFKVYPKIQKGSKITVGKVVKTERQKKREKKEIDWAKVVADAIGQATGVLSLILLIQRVN